MKPADRKGEASDWERMISVGILVAAVILNFFGASHT